MGLDRKTEEQMRQLFAGQRCCQCGAPAARLKEDRYYCHAHFRSGRRRPRGGTQSSGSLLPDPRP